MLFKNTTKKMNNYYQELYSSDDKFREIWQGRVGTEYLIPKEVGYFVEYLKSKEKDSQSILELGAGDGVSAQRMISLLNPRKYVATEINDAGVKKLKSKGISSKVMDATKIDFEDDSFDVVCCFNVMHHVNDPYLMAQEMIRVSKKHILLCESNGLSVIRKLLEFTPNNRRANEKSYFPRVYKSFFHNSKVNNINVKPFMFVYTGIPDFLFKPGVWISELMEKIPFLRWQCAGLFISLEKMSK